MFTRKSFAFFVAVLISSTTFAQSTPVAEESFLAASDATGMDEFGSALAIDQEQLIVGAPFNALGITSARQGAAYVYSRTGSTWSEDFRLTANDGDDDDRFGAAVAIDGDWAAVGAPRDQDNGLFSGSVYLFQRSGTAWVQNGKLVRAGGGAGDQFGGALDMEGSTLLVGAPTDDTVAGEGGVAYVYVRTGTTWNLEDTLIANDNAEMDLFGTSVALDGDRAAIGASMDESANAQRGKAYVFLRTGTTWAQETVLGPSDAATFAHLGRSIDLSGDLLVSGAPERSNGVDFVGAAYVWRRSGTVWNPEDILVPSDAQANDFFGAALSFVNDRIVIGAPQQSEVGLRAGAAYVFEASGTDWNQTGKLFASNILPDDRFGSTIAGDGARFVAGSPKSDLNGPESGSAYVFATPDFPEFCFGDGGNQAGCTNCPCSNNATIGSGGGCLNSGGAGARLIGSGNPSVTLPPNSTTDLRFGLTGAPANAFCILNSGDAVAPGNPVNPCFGMNSGAQAASFDGLRCAITNTRRHGGRSADVSGEVGVTNNPWGGEGGPPVGIANAGDGFGAGQTRYFQVIHRDEPLAVCMRGLNTSQAIEITFFP